MKKKFIIGLIALSAGCFSATHLQAQDTTTVGEDLKKAGKKPGKLLRKVQKK